MHRRNLAGLGGRSTFHRYEITADVAAILPERARQSGRHRKTASRDRTTRWADAVAPELVRSYGRLLIAQRLLSDGGGGLHAPACMALLSPMAWLCWPALRTGSSNLGECLAWISDDSVEQRAPPSRNDGVLTRHDQCRGKTVNHSR